MTTFLSQTPNISVETWKEEFEGLKDTFNQVILRTFFQTRMLPETQAQNQEEDQDEEEEVQEQQEQEHGGEELSVKEKVVEKVRIQDDSEIQATRTEEEEVAMAIDPSNNERRET